MPRTRTRKTQKGLFTDDNMREAVESVLKGASIRQVAIAHNFHHSTLARYVKKQKQSDTPLTRMTPNYSVRRVFTLEQENELVRYLVSCSKMFYGLPMNECRQIALEMALLNNITVPKSWHVKKMAGIDWMDGFRSRNPILSLRTPEGCSLARATSFNPHNVAIFYDKLYEVLQRNPNFSNGSRIYNLDETSTMTVQKHQKVLAVKGTRQVSKVTSGERGTLVTTACIIAASGQYLPPVMIFPRVHFKSHMLNGAPPGTLGLATSSGWMNTDLFKD